MKDGKYTTKHGSIVVVKEGRLKSCSFDWFGEPKACCDCGCLYVEINKLFWECEECGGGSADLIPEKPATGLTKYKGAFKNTDNSDDKW